MIGKSELKIERAAMVTALKMAAGVAALIFIGVGFAWWLAPAFVGAQLGMKLQSGVGLSTQIGDIASFFFTLGACTLIAVLTGNRTWLWPSIMLLAFAVAGRVIAWSFYGAVLTIEIIALEISVIGLLLMTVRSLGKGAPGS